MICRQVFCSVAFCEGLIHLDPACRCWTTQSAAWLTSVTCLLAFFLVIPVTLQDLRFCHAIYVGNFCQVQTSQARLESQSLFHKLSSVTCPWKSPVTCLSKSLCSWFQVPCMIIFFCRWSWGVLVSVKTFFMSLGLVTWCLGKSFKSGCGQDGSRQGLP